MPRRRVPVRRRSRSARPGRRPCSIATVTRVGSACAAAFRTASCATRYRAPPSRRRGGVPGEHRARSRSRAVQGGREVEQRGLEALLAEAGRVDLDQEAAELADALPGLRRAPLQRLPGDAVPIIQFAARRRPARTRCPTGSGPRRHAGRRRCASARAPTHRSPAEGGPPAPRAPGAAGAPSTMPAGPGSAPRAGERRSARGRTPARCWIRWRRSS